MFESGIQTFYLNPIHSLIFENNKKNIQRKFMCSLISNGFMTSQRKMKVFF